MNDHIGVYAYVRFVRDAVLRLVPRSIGGRTREEQERATAAKAVWTRSNGANGNGTLARRVRNAVLWNKTVRRLLYPVDLLVFLCYRLYVEGVKKQVLVMDRYFYDSLVDVADDWSWSWLRLLERITPTPTMAVFLDISPEESYARKGEYSVEYLHRRSLAYRRVFPWVHSAVALRNEELDATKRVLQQAVLERIGRS
jgi:hypothetical protein